MRPGAEMDCPLQAVHLCLLKRILGVKKTTPSGRYCVNVGLSHCNSIGFKQLSDPIMPPLSATAKHYARCLERILT
eukprot:1111126-Pelagomonas_calceolata.AAC.1